MAARVRFVLFCLIVLGLPGGLMASGDPRWVDLGKLALILGPAVTGLALNFGLGNRGERVRWRGVGVAALLTLTVAGLALAVSLVAGASVFAGERLAPSSAAAALGATALTSVLEELGWAGGGLGLALEACGRRVGVAILGLVWATWHLIPTFLKVGLFPELEVAPPLMLVAFVVACLIYRELLTRFVERSRSWLAAAAGHAAPNLMFTGCVAFGLVILERPEAWPLFPAPGGLVFPALALAAVLALRRRTSPSAV
jgi:membrane protease YdiL (CAAX protease family)